MFLRPGTLAGLARLQRRSQEVQDKVSLPTCHVLPCVFLTAVDMHMELLGCGMQEGDRERDWGQVERRIKK